MASTTKQEMEAFRKHGNTLFSQGDHESALCLFTKGLQCMNAGQHMAYRRPATDSAIEAERVMLLNNRALAYARLSKWAESLDDGLCAVRGDGAKTAKTWARIIAAVHNMNLAEVEISLLPLADRNLDGDDFESLMRSVRLLASPRRPRNYDDLEFDISHVKGELDALRNPASPLFIVMASGLCVMRNDNKEHGYASLRAIRGPNGLDLIGRGLLEFEQPDCEHVNDLVSLQVDHLYRMFFVAGSLVRESASDILLEQPGIVAALAISMRRRLPVLDPEGPESEIKVLRKRRIVHRSQLKVISQVGLALGAEKQWGMFNVDTELVQEWLEGVLKHTRMKMLEGGVNKLKHSELLPLKRFSSAIYSLELMLKANVVEAVAGIIEATVVECASETEHDPNELYFERDDCLAYILDMALRLSESQPGMTLFLNALGMGNTLLGEARLRQLLVAWKTHSFTSCIGSIVSDCYRRLGYPLKASDTVKSYMKHHRVCSGYCCPRKMETQRNEFIISVVHPFSHERVFFCSQECCDNAPRLKARDRVAELRQQWTQIMDNVRKGSCETVRPYRHFIQGGRTALEDCQWKVVHEWWRPVPLMDVVQLMALNTSPNIEEHPWLILRVWMLYTLHAAAADSEDGRWQKKKSNVENVLSLLKDLEFVYNKAIMEMEKEDDFLIEPIEPPSNWLPEKSLSVIMEMYSMAVLHLLWADEDFPRHVVRALDMWMHPRLRSIRPLSMRQSLMHGKLALGVYGLRKCRWSWAPNLFLRSLQAMASPRRLHCRLYHDPTLRHIPTHQEQLGGEGPGSNVAD